MKFLSLPFEQFAKQGQITISDLDQIQQCRRDHNKLGFAYQLAFVRIFNRFPLQQPFEVLDELLSFISIQMNLPGKLIAAYMARQPTLSEHQEAIRQYLALRRPDKEELDLLGKFLFNEACRLEQINALLMKADQFLRENKILKPSEATIKRIIGTQRRLAQDFIFSKLTGLLPSDLITKLNALLVTEEKTVSNLQFIKNPPGKPSPGALIKLVEKIERIKEMGVLEIDLTWLSNNFQRFLSRYVKRCNVKRIRELDASHRYSALVCFLIQIFGDTIDALIDMFDKLMTRVCNHAQGDIDDYHKSQRKSILKALAAFKALGKIILDEDIQDSALRKAFFSKIKKADLINKIGEVDAWLTGKHSHVFNLIQDHFSYIRQFSPFFLKHIQLESDTGNPNPELLEAVNLLKEMNSQNKRKLPDNAPVGFIPKGLLSRVVEAGEVEKSAWECALLIAVRDEIKSGNLSVRMSKRFGRFDAFFMPEQKWNEQREAFFGRANLPVDPETVPRYLAKRLNQAFDLFLESLPNNIFVTIDEHGWHLSPDPGDKPELEKQRQIDHLNEWLADNMRVIKLPELLIEVDNDLKITRLFLSPTQQENPKTEDICDILAVIMAQGCNIGPYTMSHMIEGINYDRIRHISDWMFSEESQRAALTVVVNAISQLDVTKAWGEGKTSSSDGQRFSLSRKVLQQTYSQKFNDFALEFYTFVADNYAPFFSFPIECTDRDAPYVLDGLLYNETDLPLEEHYTDTHGYTENNFAAFAMLGRRFAPRIRGLHKQRIYRIDKNRDVKALSPLVDRRDSTIHMASIVEQWDRLGHFYASLECGHTTASTAMSRLNGFTQKNHFYRANRELGRIFKTEHILQYMSDKALRQRTRNGLLKGEQLHALARDLNYGKRGRITTRDLQEQKSSCSCLTLILAAIVYWQAKEINRVILQCNPKGSGIDLKLMAHISPITWDNVILYGEYVLDKTKIRL